MLHERSNKDPRRADAGCQSQAGNGWLPFFLRHGLTLRKTTATTMPCDYRLRTPQIDNAAPWLSRGWTRSYVQYDNLDKPRTSCHLPDLFQGNLSYKRRIREKIYSTESLGVRPKDGNHSEKSDGKCSPCTSSRRGGHGHGYIIVDRRIRVLLPRTTEKSFSQTEEAEVERPFCE